jgi:predicted site-specific integrase-resolvase
MAKKLDIGRTTLRRWIRSGKLLKPEKSISGMLLFPNNLATLAHSRNETV